MIQQHNCYSQLNYNEMPDTLYHEYEYGFVTQRLIPENLHVDHIVTPIRLEVSLEEIETKYIYKDCTNCTYEEYIDSLEVRPAYNKILLQKRMNYKYEEKRLNEEEWAWVKMYEEIPKDHKKCLDTVGIDTCLWKYVIIEEENYDTILRKTANLVLDTIRIPPLIVPIKKYRLKNKSHEEIEKLFRMDVETVLIGIYKIREEEVIRPVYMGTYETVNRKVIRHIRKITPLNYKDN